MSIDNNQLNQIKLFNQYFHDINSIDVLKPMMKQYVFSTDIITNHGDIILCYGICIALRNNNHKLLELINDRRIAETVNYRGCIKSTIIIESLKFAIQHKYNIITQYFITNYLFDTFFTFHTNVKDFIINDIIEFSILYNNLELCIYLLQYIITSGNSSYFSQTSGITCEYFIYKTNNIELIKLFNKIRFAKDFRQMITGVLDSPSKKISNKKLAFAYILDMLKEMYDEYIFDSDTIKYFKLVEQKTYTQNLFLQQMVNILKLSLPNHVYMYKFILQYNFYENNKNTEENRDSLRDYLNREVILDIDDPCIIPFIGKSIEYKDALKHYNSTIIHYLLHNTNDISHSGFLFGVDMALKQTKFNMLVTFFNYDPVKTLKYIKSLPYAPPKIHVEDIMLRKSLILHQNHNHNKYYQELISIICMCKLHIASSNCKTSTKYSPRSKEVVYINNNKVIHDCFLSSLEENKDNNSTTVINNNNNNNQGIVTHIDTNLSYNYFELLNDREQLVVRADVYIAKYQQWKNGLHTILSKQHNLPHAIIQYNIFKFI